LKVAAGEIKPSVAEAAARQARIHRKGRNGMSDGQFDGEPRPGAVGAITGT